MVCVVSSQVFPCLFESVWCLFVVNVDAEVLNALPLVGYYKVQYFASAFGHVHMSVALISGVENVDHVLIFRGPETQLTSAAVLPARQHRAENCNSKEIFP